MQITPSSDSALSGAWSEPVIVSTTARGRDGQPLAKVVQNLAKQVGIEIDTTQVESPNSMSFHLNGHPFHHTLGILLYETGCGCRLEGERLVILPPENLQTGPE
jgi:hypothetical protein